MMQKGTLQMKTQCGHRGRNNVKSWAVKQELKEENRKHTSKVEMLEISLDMIRIMFLVYLHFI